MKEIFINPARTCAFTGHRTLYKDFDVEKLKVAVKELIKDGYDTFLNGMALGFDTESFKVLSEIKKENDIKIIACVPCPSQSAKFTEEEKETYEKLLKEADETVVISEKYTPYCMNKRNRFMADNSSALIAYLKRDYGGTFFTVNYAEKAGKKIIYV